MYPEATTWTWGDRRWLAAQAFAESVSELTYADLIAGVDGLTARKAALAERIVKVATDGPWWPTVARLRAFRGDGHAQCVRDPPQGTAGDWQRFKRHRVGSLAPG